MDIPFIRFAFPLAVLYIFYSALWLNPWVEEADEDASNPNALSVRHSQELLWESKQLLLAGKLKESLMPTLRLYRAFPENHIYIQQLAQTYDTLGQFKESAPLWDRYLQTSPTPIEGCPMVGLAHENLGQAAEAKQAFERCWKIEPTSDMIFFYGHAVERDGDYTRAAELYEQGLKRAPDYPDLQIGLARAQLQLGKLPASRQRIEAVLARRPDNADALLVAALVHWRMGELGAARENLEHAHRVSPGYKEAEVMLAELRGQSATPRKLRRARR